MAVITFLPQRKVLKKPNIPAYQERPATIGGHIRKARMQRDITQLALAQLLHVAEDTITGWELERYSPRISQYPAIIEFLGYYPLEHDKTTHAGMIEYCRHSRGWSYRQMGKQLDVNACTVKDWQEKNRIADPAAQFQLVLLTT